jgi:hypothetical protein
LGIDGAASPEQIRKQFVPLREFGWVEGTNLQIERRFANSLEELKPLAEESVRAVGASG